MIKVRKELQSLQRRKKLYIKLLIWANYNYCTHCNQIVNIMPCLTTLEDLPFHIYIYLAEDLSTF